MGLKSRSESEQQKLWQKIQVNHDRIGCNLQVVPHITDAIQNWVERVASIPVGSSMVR